MPRAWLLVDPVLTPEGLDLQWLLRAGECHLATVVHRCRLPGTDDCHDPEFARSQADEPLLDSNIGPTIAGYLESQRCAAQPNRHRWCHQFDLVVGLHSSADDII